MPHYAPQPMPAKDPGHSSRSMPPHPQPAGSEIAAQAAVLGRSIRREQGMQGVRRYVKAMVPFLQADELAELAKLLGVPCPSRETEHKHAEHSPPPPNQQQAAPNTNNMAQLLQLFSQFSSGTNQSTGNQGINPMMLAQLMNAMNNGHS